jgi:hypothetical protein
LAKSKIPPQFAHAGFEFVGIDGGEVHDEVRVVGCWQVENDE